MIPRLELVTLTYTGKEEIIYGVRIRTMLWACKYIIYVTADALKVPPSQVTSEPYRNWRNVH